VPRFLLTRRHALAAVGGALALVFAAAHFLLPPVPASPPAAAGPLPAAGTTTGAPPPGAPPVGGAPAPGATPTLLVVDVTGAVRRPGVYRLPQGARVTDAIARAGGATPRADTALVNLAAPLADGEQVLVPRRVAGVAPGAGGGPSTPAATGPVHLNSATVEQLDALPGVGPVTAQKIVDYRQAHGAFTSVDELDAIPGIGPAKVADLREVVAP
jgi:competence protein ComEA